MSGVDEEYRLVPLAAPASPREAAASGAVDATNAGDGDAHPTPFDPLSHVLVSVLHVDDTDDPFLSAVEAAGIMDIDDLLCMTKADLAALRWGTDLADQLSPAQVNLLAAVISWFIDQGTDDVTIFAQLSSRSL